MWRRKEETVSLEQMMTPTWPWCYRSAAWIMKIGRKRSMKDVEKKKWEMR